MINEHINIYFLYIYFILCSNIKENDFISNLLSCVPENNNNVIFVDNRNIYVIKLKMDSLKQIVMSLSF